MLRHDYESVFHTDQTFDQRHAMIFGEKAMQSVICTFRKYVNGLLTNFANRNSVDRSAKILPAEFCTTLQSSDLEYLQDYSIVKRKIQHKVRENNG